MPQQSSRMFPKVLIMLLIATLIAVGAIMTSSKDEEMVPAADNTEPAPGAQEEVIIVGPTTTPADIAEITPIKIVPQETAPISENVEAQIREINAKVDAGELTREGAQRLINELLGL